MEEEVVEEPRPVVFYSLPHPQVVFTLEEYEAQRKAKMSALIGKKEARAVEDVKGEKIERVEGDYFVVCNSLGE